MKHLFTLLLNFTLLTAFAQTPGWQWVQHGGGDGYPGSSSSSPGRDIIHCSAFDAQGNLIVGGYCSWYPEFDSISFPNVGGSANWDNETFFLAKYDKYGNVVWVRVGGGVGYDDIVGLDVDEAGNIYTFGALGATGNTAVINTPAKDTILPGNTNTLYNFSKWDKDGNLLYIHTYPYNNDFWNVIYGQFKRLKNGTFLSIVGAANTSGTVNVGGFTTANNSRNFVVFDTLGNVLKLAMIDTTAQYSHNISNFVLDENENIYFSLINLSQPNITILSQVFNPAQQYTAHLIKTDTSFIIKDIAYG